ncbi:MAG TPA: CapA family protein [Steroidobacteraceae bacterium]|nr:CapA family protein [Steroidobacteraceae bacterium]
MQLTFAGDLILDEPNPDHWLSGIASSLHEADVAIGHLEVPHTTSTEELHGDVPAPAAPPEHLSALKRAGFDAVSLAGNHIADRGPLGIADTVSTLDSLEIAHTGAGLTLAQARQPAYLAVGSRALALLSYNCVGPEGSWAREHRAGCSYICVRPADGGTIAPAASLEHLDADSLNEMARDVAKARERAEFVIVALHKGIVHTRARLAPYERAVAHAVIDAGADIVLGHHAHIVRGIELYKGKPIFHGLGNGCVVTRALSPDQSHPARAAWARRRRELFGFEPDPAYPLAPFHPEAVNAFLGRVSIDDTGALRAGFRPVDVEPPGRPVVAGSNAFERICRYVKSITVEAGMPALKLQAQGADVWLM